MKAQFLGVCLLGSAWALAPSVNPPGGLNPAQVPQFIVLGSDDNGSEVDWLVAELGKRKHLDGTPLHMSFYSNQHGDASWVSAHNQLIQAGHELGLHTFHHADLSTLSLDSVQKEFSRNRADLIDQLGVNSGDLVGARAPFLALDDSVLTAESKLGLLYDCSLEEGWQSDKNASNQFWPYTLDQASTSSAWAAQRQLKIAVKDENLSNHPGLWEIPVYAWELPVGQAALDLGLPSAFCDTLSVRAQDLGYGYADPKAKSCKVTGFDYNQWFQYGLKGAEYDKLLRHQLNRRLAGNRAPLTIGMHANYYGVSSDEYSDHSAGLLNFIDYALQNPAVRFVSARELVQWMQSPTVPVEYQDPLKHQSSPMLTVKGVDLGQAVGVGVGKFTPAQLQNLHPRTH